MNLKQFEKWYRILIYIYIWLGKSISCTQQSNTFQFPLWWRFWFCVQVNPEDQIFISPLCVLVHGTIIWWLVITWLLLVNCCHMQQWKRREQLSWPWCLQTVLVPSTTFQNQLSHIHSFYILISALFNLFLIFFFDSCWVNDII